MHIPILPFLVIIKKQRAGKTFLEKPLNFINSPAVECSFLPQCYPSTQGSGQGGLLRKQTQEFKPIACSSHFWVNPLNQVASRSVPLPHDLLWETESPGKPGRRANPLPRGQPPEAKA